MRRNVYVVNGSMITRRRHQSRRWWSLIWTWFNSTLEVRYLVELYFLVKWRNSIFTLLFFAGDNVDCWMEIQHGKGPWAPPVSGIVPLGSTLTLVVAINDYRGMNMTNDREAWCNEKFRGGAHMISTLNAHSLSHCSCLECPENISLRPILGQ